MSQPDPAATGTSHPTLDGERLAALDVLRGFALLGILLMNIQSFAMIDAAYLNPTATGPLEGSEFWVWSWSHLLADQKFMTIFSVLYKQRALLLLFKVFSKLRLLLVTTARREEEAIADDSPRRDDDADEE